jgi:hypothetical protein
LHVSDSLNLTQTAIALISLSAITILYVSAYAFSTRIPQLSPNSVIAHHRKQAAFLTQAQEELSLIAAFGLFCLALSVAYRVIRQRSGEHIMGEHVTHETHTHVEMGRVGVQTVATPLARVAAYQPPPPPPPEPVQPYMQAQAPIRPASAPRERQVYAGYRGGYHDAQRPAYGYGGRAYDGYVYY